MEFSIEAYSEILLSLGMMILGLFLLFWCGDKLVDGAVGLAERFKVSPLFIGVAVIGFGTSFPEIIASGTAAFVEKPTISISNIIGSNIANLGLVLGLGLLLMKRVKPNKDQMREFLMMNIAMWCITILFLVFGQINALMGAMLLVLLGAYLYMSLQSGKSSFEEAVSESDTEKGSITKPITLVVIGLIGLFIGAKLAVDGAVSMAQMFGVSERVIGLTLVAVGTSLPEIAATFAAARHGNIALTIGNVMGSNTFNSLAGLGTSSLLTPLIAEEGVKVDLFTMIIAAIIVSYLFLSKKPNTKILGAVLVAFYASYLLYLGLS